MVHPVSFARGSAIAILGFAAVTAGAFAQNEVTQEITSGQLSASVEDADLTTIAYSNVAGSTSGTLALTVDDSRGIGTGWSVSISSSDFIYDDTSPIGLDIPNTGFNTTGFGTLVVNAGQAAPAPSVGAGGTFSSDVTILSAVDASGSGNYTQAFGVSLDIPAQSQAGTYLATLTVTIAPDAP
ncbi:MAG: WxL domain-containing protein [Thermomicrobiales bacterium]